jgi:hypothetical protein
MQATGWGALMKFFPAIACALLLGSVPAQAADAPAMPVPFEPMNPGGKVDHIGQARRLAAAIVVADGAQPKSIVDVGSFTGEFLEAFMAQFPQAHGQWTEPVDNNQVNAQHRFARYGNRLTYRIGCPGRDLAQGCVPAGVDVLLSSWLTIHQNLDGIRDFHRRAYAMLPDGGWIAVIDHTRADPRWAARLGKARETLTGLDLAAQQEGPPVHHPEFVTPSLEEQIAAMREAGFGSVRVVWSRLDTVLLMARKN